MSQALVRAMNFLSYSLAHGMNQSVGKGVTIQGEGSLHKVKGLYRGRTHCHYYSLHILYPDLKSGSILARPNM